MPKTLDELNTSDNLRMFNLLFRHQVYLEGVKSGFAGDYRAMLDKLYGEFARYLALNRYETIDQFTKGELGEFIYRFTRAQSQFYSHYTDELIKLLQQFLAVDLGIHKEILQEVTAKTPAQANQVLKPEITEREYNDLPEALQADYVEVTEDDATDDGKPFPVMYQLTAQYQINQNASGIYGNGKIAGTDESNAELWATVTHQPMPASGTYLLDSIAQFGKASNAAIDATITKGYANAWTTRELQTALLGDNSDFQGGLLKTFFDKQLALIATGIQHISNEVQSAVASIYYERYEWVSIMDNVTTEICRSRNGIVYIFGTGPFPPAHWFCRSKVVPVASGDKLSALPSTFYEWIVTQPEWIVSDMLGADVAAAISAGATFALVRGSSPLTLAQFQAKLRYILGA